MNICIDDEGFEFGGHRFIYSFYWMHLENFQAAAESSTALFKQILVKWAHALREMNDEKKVMFLPFAPDDQEIACLKARWNGDKIEFAMVEVKEDAVTFDWNDIEGFIVSPHEIYHEPYVPIGEFAKVEVVDALLNAHIHNTKSERGIPTRQPNGR